LPVLPTMYCPLQTIRPSATTQLALVDWRRTGPANFVNEPSSFMK
jgi:hypothetical protein